jgi:cytochrome c oxidase assembly protein subunit 15
MNTVSRMKAMRGVAWLLVLLMLAVTSLSAGLRLTPPRPECADWPVCRAPPAPGGSVELPVLAGTPPAVAAARAAHRVTASLALLSAGVLVLLSLARRPRHRTAGGLAIALLLLALGLAALGIVTPGSRAVAVLLGNLLGGLLMLALAWRLTRHLSGGGVDAGGPSLGWWALAGALLWAVQAALGAMSGTGAAIGLPIGHQALSFAPGAFALGVGWTARRRGLRPEGTALMAVGVLQWLLGATAARFDASVTLVLVHNVGAAVGLALLAGLIGRGRART